MSMQDPISDLLTRIRNGYVAKKEFIIVSLSKIKLSIVNLLVKENFLDKYSLLEVDDKKYEIKVFLRYYGNNIPIMKSIVRISKPSNRVYKRSKDLPRVLDGFGMAIVSTSRGLLTDKQARKLGHGGEVICIVE